MFIHPPFFYVYYNYCNCYMSFVTYEKENGGLRQLHATAKLLLSVPNYFTLSFRAVRVKDDLCKLANAIR